jgi:hypothetical protein
VACSGAIFSQVKAKGDSHARVHSDQMVFVIVKTGCPVAEDAQMRV